MIRDVARGDASTAASHADVPRDTRTEVYRIRRCIYGGGDGNGNNNQQQLVAAEMDDYAAAASAVEDRAITNAKIAVSVMNSANYGRR